MVKPKLKDYGGNKLNLCYN